MEFIYNFSAMEDALVGLSPAYSNVKSKMHNVGVPRFILLAYVVVAVLMLMLGVIGLLFGSKAVTQCVAFIYPAYQTIKALKSTKKEDDTFWLCYWVFYGAINHTKNPAFIHSYIGMNEAKGTMESSRLIAP